MDYTIGLKHTCEFQEASNSSARLWKWADVSVLTFVLGAFNNKINNMFYYMPTGDKRFKSMSKWGKSRQKILTWQQNGMKWTNEYAEYLIAPFISCTIMKNNHKKDWKPKIMYNLFSLKWGPSSESLFSAFFRVVLNHRVFIHDMFHFIRHSPFLSFDKCQKNTYTYIYIHLYI